MESTSEPDIRNAFLQQLVATSDGRQHMLSVSVDAEEGDEGGIFEQLAEVVDDPQLRQLVERHREDEVRHAQLFRACLSRLGLEKVPVPDELKIIRQIADAVGGGRQGVRGANDVMMTYALLRAIEERGVEQFPLIADAFRRVDPETADVYMSVARDERGHVRYCEQIGRHYAPDQATWEQALTDARALEAAAFTRAGLANLAYCGERGWVRMDGLVGT